ncbi:MAG: thiol oxidoreductase-like protein [Proteobacteria bacterium]|uniref:di-heme oxidoredictase family protein n=1 Tax=Rudaea sp. TaxID=2136325 RepID=UPI00322063FB|nr:thiol oxidoreductase-like protein [Pseudomonadota bacterium]
MQTYPQHPDHSPLLPPTRFAAATAPRRSRAVRALLAATLAFAAASAAHAQLTDVTQTHPNVPGGAIGKSLQQQVGAGRGDESTPGSSLYLIARDPARAIRRGRQVFQRKFTLEQGQGPRVDFASHGDIMAQAAFGAGLTDSCAACHGRPRGSAGFGGDVATRPDSRNAPHLFGIGLREMLADEMTHDLRTIRDLCGLVTAITRMPITLPLASKGVSFGWIKSLPGGKWDTSQVQGVDADLRVRPFFHDGREFSLRAFAVGAFNDEMGLQAADPVLCAPNDPANPVATTTPGGLVLDPKLDAIKHAPTCSPADDADGDGVANEVDPALIDYVEIYLLNYFRPAVAKTSERSEQGRALLAQIGCTGCHVARFTIEHDRRVADVDTKYDATRGGFNRLYANATTLFRVVADGAAYPKLVPKREPFVVDNLFTDFKRHDLGPAFHERNYDGSLHTQFMTTPLWGVGTKSPYGHDGRSMNLEEAILRHGGEAQFARDAFAALDDDARHRLVEFLQTLVLFPPDDTASNLNPGMPGSIAPQDPAQHGSIALSALFQIPAEGAE